MINIFMNGYNKYFGDYAKTVRSLDTVTTGTLLNKLDMYSDLEN